MVLAPDTAPLHAPACPRCGGRLVQLEEPTCRLCGFADYSLPGLTCGICMEPLTGDRQRYCSTACVTLAGNRRKALFVRNRGRLGLCIRCGVPADATYCPRHVTSVAVHGRQCNSLAVTASFCELHRQQHNARAS